MWRIVGSEQRLARSAALGPARAGWRRWLPILPVLTLLSVGCSSAQGPSTPQGHSTSRAPSTPATPRADPAAARIGQWTMPFDIGAVAIHSQVMPNGKVLLWAYPRSTVGTWAVVLDPATRTFTNVSMSYQRDAFCSGNDLLPNGDVFLTGGHQYHGQNPSTHEDDTGSPDTDTFNPATETWTQGPPMDQARWYPTNLELEVGRVPPRLIHWWPLRPCLSRRVEGVGVGGAGVILVGAGVLPVVLVAAGEEHVPVRQQVVPAAERVTLVAHADVCERSRGGIQDHGPRADRASRVGP